MASMPPRVHCAPLAGSGAKRRPSRASRAFEVAVDDAGLDAHRVAADLEDGAEVPAQIDDQAGAERLAGHAGAGAARHQRDAGARRQ